MLYKVAQYSPDCFWTFERELSPESIRITHTMGYFFFNLDASFCFIQFDGFSLTKKKFTELVQFSIDYFGFL